MGQAPGEASQRKGKGKKKNGAEGEEKEEKEEKSGGKGGNIAGRGMKRVGTAQDKRERGRGADGCGKRKTEVPPRPTVGRPGRERFRERERKGEGEGGTGRRKIRKKRRRRRSGAHGVEKRVLKL